MVSIYDREFVRNEPDENNIPRSVERVTVYCKSSDEKPTQGIANGSTCVVMDTREVSFFDGDTGQWI